jgi:hypothetical protein
MDFNIFFLPIYIYILFTNNQKHSDNGINNPKYYELSKLFNKPFTKIKFNNTSMSEIERIINFLKLKKLTWLS